MSTSLAEQLRRLQTPQSSQFVDTKKRDSILFSAKEAATKSRETIFEIGLSGLQELIEINSSFSEFESTLFDATSKEVQRAVETKEVNELLNKNIKRFMFHLSPYFLIPSSHKCLEWLIRRFNVNLYNKAELLMLILPYHQTNIFVRCVQAMKFDDPLDKWSFLETVKKTSTPLSKYAIWNYASSNPSFMEFVGKFTYEAMKDLGTRAGSLQTMISFYFTTIVGTLEQVPVVNENHILSVVKYLGKTFKSNIADYTAAGYMITAHLLSKTKLILKLLNSLMEQVVKDVHPQLSQNALLLLVVMFQTQSSELKVTDATLLKLMEYRWTLKLLNQIQTDGKIITDFLKALVRSLLNKIQEKDEQHKETKDFCELLLNEIDLNEEDAGIIIRTVLESYVQEQTAPDEKFTSDSEIIEIDSDDEEAIPFKSQDITLWYSEVLKMLERRYPMAFDLVVKNVMTSNPQKRKRNGLKNVLGFLLKVSCADGSATSVYENLYHHNPHIRTEAVSYIVKNIEKLTLGNDNNEILKLSINERINDDNPDVVAEVLKINSSVLNDILGKDELNAKLMKVLVKYWNKPEKWTAVCLSSLEILATNFKDFNLNYIAFLPFLFPQTGEEIKFFEIIRASEMGKYLKLSAIKSQKTDKIHKSIFDSLKQSTKVSSELLLTTIQSKPQQMGSFSEHFTILALALSLNSPQDASFSLKALRYVKNAVGNAKLCSKSITDTSTVKHHEVPISVISTFIENLMKVTNFTSKSSNLNFKSQDDDSKLIFEIFEFIVNAFFTIDEECRGDVNNIIKIVLNSVCDNQVEKMEFLSQFCTIHAVKCEHFELQVRVMELMIKALPSLSDENFSNDFFQNITIALSSKSNVIRDHALQIVDSLETLNNIDSHWSFFFENVVKRRNEILMDFEQISLIIFLMTSAKKKSTLIKKVVDEILKRIENPLIVDYIQSELLLLLKHLTDRQVLDVMAQIAIKFMENSTKSFDDNQAISIKLVLLKINGGTINNLWNLATKALRCHQLMNDEEGRILTPSILVLQAIQNDIFIKLHPDHKMELFNSIVRCSMIENPKIKQAARKAFQIIDLDCKIVRDILKKMFKIGNKGGKGGSKDQDAFTSDDWKFGIVLLELLQVKTKGMKNQDELVGALFEVLGHFLQLNYESEIEYAIQIILTLLLSICQQISPNGREHRNIPDSMLKTELVINCIKISPNPQTHHHALLLLSHLALMTPEKVLQDIVPIFTFVGNALVRHDDSYSYQIIEKVIENIIPKLIRQGGDELKAVVPVLKIFSLIVLDVPEHRRLALYSKLLETLGPEKFLWPFIAVLLEHQIMIKKKQQKQTAEDLPPRLFFALLLAKEFSLRTTIETTNSLLLYLKSLPMIITTQSGVPSSDHTIFCLKTHTNFQLRGFKYTAAVFLKYLLESKEVLKKAQTLKDTDEVDFQSLISNSLLLIPIVTKHHEANNQSEKMTGLLLQHLYDVLEAAIALLSPDMLLTFVEKLIEHESMHVRRKALEIFNWKLELNFFDNCMHADLLRLLKPLRIICNGISNETRISIEEVVQQSALNSIKILSRKFSQESTDQFVEILQELTFLLCNNESIKKELLGGLVNCIGELVFDLKVLAIGILDKILTSFVRLLTVQDDNRSTFNLLFAVASSLLKIIETVPLFLSPYLKHIIQQISRIVPALKLLQDPKIGLTTAKISKIWSTMAELVPLRVLLPTVSDVFNKIAEKGNFTSIEPLMQLSREIFQHANGADLKAYQTELTDFFIQALDFRCIAKSQLTENEINDIEFLIIQAVIALVLKQSEGSFRPLYETIYEWAIKDCEDNYKRAITFFRLTNEISISLKSLFLLFASDVIDSAANLLNKSNPSRSDGLLFDNDNRLNLYLTEFILSSLQNIFLHDHQNFINSQRFEIIMQPIVDEIENELVIKDERVQQLLRTCIAQLAVAAGDDILWKQLNYQVLLKTRSDTPEIRILGLKASVDVAKKLGEDFEPLIPETIPFLSELLEDENHKVVEACQNAVRELESTVGESLQKYF